MTPKEITLCFAEWIGNENYAFDDRDSTWFQIGTEFKGGRPYTTEELYKKFIEELNNK